jgi:hypothetical protein
MTIYRMERDGVDDRQLLREALKDWTDVDGAQYDLAVCLGLMPPGTWYDAKSIFWTNNPIGNTLYDILERLTALGVLERRDEPDLQFRWNSAFQVSYK